MDVRSMSIAELYKAHQNLDAQVVGIRKQQGEISEEICAKEAEEFVPGDPRLHQGINRGPSGNSLADWWRNLPASAQRRIKAVIEGVPDQDERIAAWWALMPANVQSQIKEAIHGK